ncbi:MAG: hypothetical protein ACI841_004482 [Planctomycetota bacterium]
MYELVPNFEKYGQGYEVVINSHGMRDEEPRNLDPLTSSCIAAIGDSFTFGHQVENQDVWNRRLEQMLDENGLASERPVDVLNFGVSGYCTLDELAVLKHKGLAWKPDLVIVAYYLNDPEDEPLQPLHAYFDEPQWWQHSHLLRLLKKRERDRGLRRYGHGDYNVFLHSHPEKWGRVVAAFEEMKRLTQADGCELMLVVFPLAPETAWEEYKYAELHDQVAAAGQEAGMHVIDLLPHYKMHRPRSLRATSFDGHPSAMAHVVAATAITDYLSEHPELLVHRDER